MTAMLRTFPGQVVATYDPNDVKPGWIALVLLILLGIATFLLWRSMNRQLGKISVPTREELRQQAAGEGAASGTNPEPTTKPDDETPTDR